MSNDDFDHALTRWWNSEVTEWWEIIEFLFRIHEILNICIYATSNEISTPWLFETDDPTHTQRLTFMSGSFQDYSSFLVGISRNPTRILQGHGRLSRKFRRERCKRWKFSTQFRSLTIYKHTSRAWFMACSWYDYHVFHDSYHDHGMIIIFSIVFIKKIMWLLLIHLLL